MTRYVNLFSAIMVLFLFATLPSPAQAINRYVNVNGCSGMPSPCYTRVYDAVDNADAGDVIYIYPGIDTFGADLNTMNNPGNISLVTVNASGVPMPGTATMTNNDSAPIVANGFTGNITINGLIIECTDNSPGADSESALYLVDVSGNITLIDVDARSTSWDGIAIYGCDGDVSITRCTAHNSYDDGFSISESETRNTTGNVTITDSRAYGNYQDGFLIRMGGIL